MKRSLLYLLMLLPLSGWAQDTLFTADIQLLYGGYLKFAPSHFTLEGSYYRQAGHDENRCKLDAWMAAVKAEWQPNDTWGVQAGFDYLSGDDYVAVVGPGAMGMPRHEIEIEASYRPVKDVSISAGYSYMTGTETMERLKRASGDGSLRWAWLSLNISPRIFSAKW